VADVRVDPGPDAPPDEAGDALAREIAAAVRGLRYGSVEITVHDGTVVQIERKEKFRVGRDKTRSRG